MEIRDNHEFVPWLWRGGERGWLNFSCWIFPHLVTPSTHDHGLRERLWPGPGNFIETRPPSLFAIQTQFGDNLVTIMLQFSSAWDDLRDPLASKQTNKKFLSFREDFTISTSLNKQNRTDDAINQNVQEMISQMLHLTTNQHFLTWILWTPRATDAILNSQSSSVLYTV